MAVQVSHPSAFKGYRFGTCPRCGRRAIYQMTYASGHRLFRCRSCQWEHLDDDAANARVTVAFYDIGAIRPI
jgi:uncharacterized protein (DUF983 family)